jgi:hypothetical protein
MNQASRKGMPLVENAELSSRQRLFYSIDSDSGKFPVLFLGLIKGRQPPISSSVLFRNDRPLKVALSFEQGCQIFHDTMYQNGGKCPTASIITKWP